MPNQEVWIDTQAAVDLSGFHVNHIRRLVRLGKVEGRRFGPALQINRSSLLAYVKEGRKSTDGRRRKSAGD